MSTPGHQWNSAASAGREEDANTRIFQNMRSWITPCSKATPGESYQTRVADTEPPYYNIAASITVDTFATSRTTEAPCADPRENLGWPEYPNEQLGWPELQRHGDSEVQSWSVSDFEDADKRPVAICPRKGRSPTAKSDDLEEKRSHGQTPSGSPGMIARKEVKPKPALVDGNLFRRWLDEIPKPPMPEFTHEMKPTCYQSEIDACTGKPLPVIEYPSTFQNPISGPQRDPRDIGWRQANMTSEIQLVREIESRKRLGMRLGNMLRAKTMVKKTNSAQSVAPPVEERQEPSFACTLRPAEPGDFSRIAEILEWERSESGYCQFIESNPITVRTIEAISQICTANKMPFIVAIPIDNTMDQSKWPKGSERAYKEYMEFRKERPGRFLPVVGFAYALHLRLGFLGQPCPGSRHSVQVRLAVHPEYRKKSYGTALLDRMLLTLSPLHHSVGGHKWECSAPAGLYETLATHNDLQCARAYIEILCGNKEEKEYAWRAAMLVKFGFREVAYLEHAVRLDQCGQSQWLDLSQWEFEAQVSLFLRHREPRNT